MLVHILVGITLLFQNVSFAVAESEECGTITPEAQPLTLEGILPQRALVPWHSVIYSKTTKPFRALCGGSLVTPDKIISVAHCFWSHSERAPLPASQYAAAVGKLYKPWDDVHDSTAQKADVKEIHLPLRYAGIEANMQDDIALLVVARPFQLNLAVRPVCLDFDADFEKFQLKAGNMGKVAGWTLNSADGSPAMLLQTAEMPYIDIGTCIMNAMPELREFITSDKFCAGAGQPRSSLCRGDSGVGLAFSTMERGRARYYLRGVASTTSSKVEDGCDTAAYAIFTQITKHEQFLKQLLNATIV